MKENVKIIIDDQEIFAKKGSNLLEVALANGIEIPNLCYSCKITATASCRLCIVKIKGISGVTTACTHSVTNGMDVTAFDEELENLRKTLIDMLLSSHNDDCISCSKDGNCTLQDLAFKYNLGKDERSLDALWKTQTISRDETSHVISYDSTKCIMCEKCIKACKQIQGKGYINIIKRGLDSHVGTGYKSWIESKCDGCGECVQVCPVGALTVKSVYSDRKNIRMKDIDKTSQTTCPYCGVGCQINISTIKNQLVQVTGIDQAPNFGSTCVKGRFGLDFVNHPERLKKPLIKKDGEFHEVSWDEALSYTAQRLTTIKEQHGNNSIAGLSSARCTNEENYLFQKFMRSIVGTNNIDHCARL
jgi:predicted molibdopterin-dependent oxidoreductase YjgC